MSYITFHDVSYAQGLYNMDTDPSPIVEMKMTGFYYGSKVGYTDTQAVRNYSNATRLHKVPLLYHFAGGHPDPTVEADYFVTNGAMPFANGDIYELDYELTAEMGPPADPDGWCRAFVDRVKERTGVYPLFYTFRAMFNANGGFPKTMEVCSLIIADYVTSPDADVPINHPYIIQQYTDSPIDTNALFIPIDTLKEYAYGYHQTPAPAPVQTPPVVVPPAPTPAVVESTPATVTTQINVTPPVLPTLVNNVPILPKPITPPVGVPTLTHPVKFNFFSWFISLFTRWFTKKK